MILLIRVVGALLLVVMFVVLCCAILALLPFIFSIAGLVVAASIFTGVGSGHGKLDE